MLTINSIKGQERENLSAHWHVCAPKNTALKMTEKLLKYKDLETEIEKMWGMNTTAIPEAIGRLGLIKTKGWKSTSASYSNFKSLSSSGLLISLGGVSPSSSYSFFLFALILLQHNNSNNKEK